VTGFYRHLKQQEKLHCIHKLPGLLPSYVLQYVQWEKSKKSVSLNVIHHHQNPTEQEKYNSVYFSALCLVTENWRQKVCTAWQQASLEFNKFLTHEYMHLNSIINNE
jgi:hypothetical protein